MGTQALDLDVKDTTNGSGVLGVSALFPTHCSQPDNTAFSLFLGHTCTVQFLLGKVK